VEVQEIARVLGGGAVLGHPPGSLADLRHDIEAGLPVQALEEVAAHVHDRPADRRSLMLRVVPEGSLKRRAKLGRLSPSESERTARLAHIIAHAEYVWRDSTKAREFLTTSHPELGDRTPIEVSVDEFGARQVEAILDGILYGLPG
jgi:putative toxin-antitoxin system antitoxin component (TIGR02293 family)